MEQLTEEQAIAIYQGGEWEGWTDEEVVRVQLYQSRLCVKWERFHGAIEKVLGRLVWTHEFAGRDGQRRLQKEYEGKRPAPTMDDIVALIPPEKLVIIKS